MLSCVSSQFIECATHNLTYVLGSQVAVEGLKAFTFIRKSIEVVSSLGEKDELMGGGKTQSNLMKNHVYDET